MSMVTLEEAKSYLRVYSDFEDDLIAGQILSAESLCMDVARLPVDVWDEIAAYTETKRKTITLRDEEKSKGEILQMKALCRAAVFYTLGYLYEHREEADHHDLVMTLRNILFTIREGVF